MGKNLEHRVLTFIFDVQLIREPTRPAGRTIFAVACRAGAMPYAPDSGFGAGFGAGFAFFGGLDMPMLMRKNLRPLRSESITLMVRFPFPYLGTACFPGNSL